MPFLSQRDSDIMDCGLSGFGEVQSVSVSPNGDLVLATTRSSQLALIMTYSSSAPVLWRGSGAATSGATFITSPQASLSSDSLLMASFGSYPSGQLQLWKFSSDQERPECFHKISE